MTIFAVDGMYLQNAQDARREPDRNEHLVAAERSLFEQEYLEHFLVGETKDKSIGEPFLLQHPTARVGVLLVHGLMAAPEEVREWAAHLFSHGYTVYAPRMAGHGTSADDLARRGAQEWIASVDRGYDILKSRCDQVVAAGFSTGGAVVLHRVIHRPEAFAALVSISAPMKFKKFSARFARHVQLWNHAVERLGAVKFGKRFVPNHADNPHINYLRCPVNSIVEIQRLMRQVALGLPSISIPSLIIHGDRDPKVDVQSGRMIHEQIGANHKRYREVSHDKHGIVRGCVAKDVFAEVSDFLNLVMN